MAYFVSSGTLDLDSISQQHQNRFCTPVTSGQSRIHELCHSRAGQTNKQAKTEHFWVAVREGQHIVSPLGRTENLGEYGPVQARNFKPS